MTVGSISKNKASCYRVLFVYLEVNGALNYTITAQTSSSVTVEVESDSRNPDNYPDMAWSFGTFTCISSDDSSCDQPSFQTNDTTYPLQFTYTGLQPGSSYSITVSGINTNTSVADPSSVPIQVCTGSRQNLR